MREEREERGVWEGGWVSEEESREGEEGITCLILLDCRMEWSRICSVWPIPVRHLPLHNIHARRVSPYKCYDVIAMM